VSALQHEVLLVIDGTPIEVWDGYAITLDMLRPGSAWTFSLWRTEGAAQTWTQLLTLARVGAPVTFALDGVVQLDGYLERREPRADAGGAMLVLGGRDISGSVIDAHADPTLSLRNTTLRDALERLIDPLGFTIELGAGVDPMRAAPGLRPPRRSSRRRQQRRGVIDRFRVRVGETIWQCMESLCRKAGYLLWTAPGSTPNDLVLRVDSPRTTGPERFRFLRELLPDGTVSQRSNILSGSDAIDAAGIPTEVTVFADTPRGDLQPARLARTVLNDQFVIGLYARALPDRPRYSVSARARSDASARREATRILGDANANLRQYTATVQGHGQVVDGAMVLYQPNELCRVRDDITGTDLAGLLTRVEFKGSRDGGQTTELRAVPRGAIKVDPEDST